MISPIEVIINARSGLGRDDAMAERLGDVMREGGAEVRVSFARGGDEVATLAKRAMAALAACAADLFLAGHLHLSHTAQTTKRYKIEGHSAVLVQAGTAVSTRAGRREFLQRDSHSPAANHSRAVSVGHRAPRLRDRHARVIRTSGGRVAAHRPGALRSG